MSEGYRVWERIERRLRLACLAREAAHRLGGECETAWAIFDLAAEVEREERSLAGESGCERHMRIEL